VTAPARFAASVRARYLRVTNGAPVPRTLRRTLVLAIGQRHWSVNVAPQIQFAIERVDPRLPQALSARVVRFPETVQSRIVERHHTRTLLQETRATLRANALRPASAQIVRAAPAVQRVAAVQRVTRSERVPRVLQRPPHIPEQPAPPQHQFVRHNGPEPVVSLPPNELERVTTHVVRALDRRLSAWRERTGRM
jgi:hypothetical protein